MHTYIQTYKDLRLNSIITEQAFIVLERGFLVAGELISQEGKHSLWGGGSWLHQGNELQALEPIGEGITLGNPEGQDGGVLRVGHAVSLVRFKAPLKVREMLAQWVHDQF